MYAARFPPKVLSLVLVGAPIDTDAGQRPDQAHGAFLPDPLLRRTRGARPRSYEGRDHAARLEEQFQRVSSLEPLHLLSDGRGGILSPGLGPQETDNLADRGEVEPLRIGAPCLVFAELASKGGEDIGFELAEIVAAARLKHASAHGDMMLAAFRVAPGDDRSGDGRA